MTCAKGCYPCCTASMQQHWRRNKSREERLHSPDTDLFRPKALHVVLGTLDVIQLFNNLPALTEAKSSLLSQQLPVINICLEPFQSCYRLISQSPISVLSIYCYQCLILLYTFMLSQQNYELTNLRAVCHFSLIVSYFTFFF
jgi:hypothetical protein